MSDKKTESKVELKTAEPEVSAQQLMMRDTISALVKEMMPALIMAASAGRGGGDLAAMTRPYQGRGTPEPLVKCAECGQATRACEGKHVKTVVFYQKYPEYADYFQGAFINGVRYLSNGPGHKITVPAIAEGDILHQVAMAEQEEQWARVGHSRVRKSGSLNYEQTPAVQAQNGFR